MKLVLVHPAGSNWVPGKKDITPTANRMAPLGILSIAAWLEKKGHTVFVHDCLGPEASAEINTNVKLICDYTPDIVGFSATTSGFLNAYELAEKIKQINPNIRIVFGGVHISAMGAILLEHFPHIDFLVMGEGENTLAELADGNDLNKINGLIWRNGQTVVTNEPRAHIPDLDILPFPAYEKLKGFPKKYRLPLFSYINTPGATMITSRGCIYRCSYCDRSVFKRGYRYNSAEYVYDHMKYLRQRFDVRHLNIYDDLFTVHRERIAGLCKMLIQKPLGMHFNCAVRVGHVDNDLLKMLKNAGCLQISLGIETGDSDLMNVHKPGVTVEGVQNTVKQIKAQGLRVKGLFMMGLPGDTEISIRKTSDFVMSLQLDDMNMSKFTPFPGAPIWQTIKESGEFNEDWRKMNCLNFVFVPKNIGSIEKLDQLYNEHVQRFYTDSGWRKRFRNRLWEHRKSIWHMLSHLPDFLLAMRNFK